MENVDEEWPDVYEIVKIMKYEHGKEQKDKSEKREEKSKL